MGSIIYIREVRVLLAALLLFAVARVADGQTSERDAVVFDQYMTPAAGAQDLLALQHLLADVEDRWLPRRVGTERSRRALALGILYRGGKLIGVDVPQDHMLMVLAHEVFGHGARFRELGEGRIGYGFDAPIPYGSGDAFTRFNGRFPISPFAHLGVSSSGIEAQHSLADAITERAVERGRLHYREAWLYFESRLTAMTYILTATPHSSEGHDVADFLEQFDDQCQNPCAPLTRRYLQQRATLALADPLLYYSIYSFAASYIGKGETTGPMPLVPIGWRLHVLPSLGYALTPYGAEWTVRTSLQKGDRIRGRRLPHVALRVGNTGAETTWGLKARVADALTFKSFRVGATVDLWRQPDLADDTTSSPLQTGAASMATVTVPLPAFLRSAWSEGIHLTAGYKSRGYVPGEQYSGGAVFRAGITLR
jgi:hypothetical protein